ncbi:MAG: hypothetical protein ABR903_04570 [Thermodesulfovibrionales bacterium]|jgi:hypothetical protein
MKSVRVDVDNLSRQRFEAMLERLEMGYPLKFKDMRSRDSDKAEALVKFYIKTTPPAEDILSGKAFRNLFGLD